MSDRVNIMNLLEPCCARCMHTPATPCAHFLQCRMSGPQCHTDTDCADRLAAARQIALHLQQTPILYLGAGTCGLASGMDQLIPVIRDLLAQHGCEVTLKEVGCFGLCHREPMLDVKKPGRPRVCFDNVDMKKALTIIEGYVVQDELPPELAMGIHRLPGCRSRLRGDGLAAPV